MPSTYSCKCFPFIRVMDSIVCLYIPLFLSPPLFFVDKYHYLSLSFSPSSLSFSCPIRWRTTYNSLSLSFSLSLTRFTVSDDASLNYPDPTKQIEWTDGRRSGRRRWRRELRHSHIGCGLKRYVLLFILCSLIGDGVSSQIPDLDCDSWFGKKMF